MILPRTLKQTNESGDNCLLRRCYCSELLEAFAPLGVRLSHFVTYRVLTFNTYYAAIYIIDCPIPCRLPKTENCPKWLKMAQVLKEQFLKGFP